ncbi:SDR family NAD(P)-dependent oxidoreductase [Phenylobacterium terrae]|uniref:SDR family NAD(P)-dependent oxidoreductase n=1 Tax=Phenylobacterium terrae TaxID=2665495 RepID=A0ABW4N7K0_9CAUL
MQEFIGKRALVTGGGRGIGAAIVRRLAAGGAKVAVTYAAGAEHARRVTEEIAQAGGVAMALQADNRDAAALGDAVDAAAVAWGGLDILVNNAGVFHAAPIDALSLEAFDETMAINLRAVFVATKAVLPHMPDGGRIISIGSNLASQAPTPGLVAYSTSKAALIGFTRALARDLGPRGITVNVVHPGSTDTDMNPADGEAADAQRGRMAHQRFADPAEIAAVVAFLASEAGRSVNGAGWLIDNGANA